MTKIGQKQDTIGQITTGGTQQQQRIQQEEQQQQQQVGIASVFGQDVGANLQQLAQRASQQQAQAGGGILKSMGEMVQGWIGAGVRAGTVPEEVLKNKMENLKDQGPKLDEKVSLLGGKLKMSKQKVEGLDKEYNRLSTMAQAAIDAGDKDAAKGYLIQREDIKTQKGIAEGTVATTQKLFDDASELRKVTLQQIGQEIQKAHDSLNRSAASKVDKEVAKALQEVQSAVTGGTDHLVSQIDAKSAAGEAALELAMSDSGALKDARILNTARQKQGDSLLAAFEAGKP